MLIISLITGTIAFIFMVLFEALKCLNIKKGLSKGNPWFYIGMLLLIASFVLICLAGKPGGLVRLSCGLAVTVAGVITYIKILGVGTKEYNDDIVMAVSREGFYGKERHPGVWCFLIISLGIGLMFKGAIGPALYLAGLNLIYCILQDKYFFPVYLEGYDEYKNDVPFI